MGLKSKNYISQRKGLILANAYAKLSFLVLESNNTVRAQFSIHESREALDKYQPVEVIEVRFVWDRQSDLAKMAYETLKSLTKTTIIEDENDAELDEIVQVPLHDWEDDII